MVIFTLTIWGAFGVIYVIQQTPTLSYSELKTLDTPEYYEYAAEIKRFDIIEQTETNGSSDEETINETSDNVYQQASSSANDILYSFEKDQPVSVDQLLIALGISE